MKFLYVYSFFMIAMTFCVAIQERIKGNDKYPKDVQNMNILLQLPMIVFFIAFLFGFDV